MWQYGLSFFAGMLTSLSPCVLPALPLVLGSARAESKAGPLAMAAGLTLSFTVLGYTLASLGSIAGFDEIQIKTGAAVLLMGAGVFLLSRTLQEWLGHRLNLIACLAGTWLHERRFAGAWGQFLVGALLGALWSPCVGPTLGAAVGLAAQNGWSAQALFQMFLFGLGTALPLLLMGLGLRNLFGGAHRRAIASISEKLKPGLGVVVILVGGVYLLGLEGRVEGALLSLAPKRWILWIAQF